MAKITTRNKLLILTAVMASLLEIIDTSIVNVAIPSMMGNLGATLDEISWVITGYIIANAIVLPISSWFSEQFGRKLYYTTCILLFTAASVACGMAPSLPVLVIFRVVQGFAGGALLPTSQALIYEAFPREMAGMASAIYGMSVMIGPTIGPTLGGYLTDTLGWRSIFNINLPIGLVVAALSYFLVEDVGFDVAQPKVAKADQPKRQRNPIDVWGLVMLVVGIGCLQYVLERGHAEDWFASASITISAVLAVGCLSGLVWWELRAPHPILQLKHFANATFRSGIFLMTGLGFMLYGLIFMIPVFVSTVLNFDATQTGELFIPGALAAAAVMPVIGMQLRKRDPRTLIFIGVLSLITAIFMVSRFNSQTSVGGMFWPLMIRGIAMAFLFVPINTTVLSQFKGAAIGQAAGLLNLCRQLGGSMGIAILSTLLQQYQVQNYAALSSHITWFDPVARQVQQMLSSGMHSRLANELGMGLPSLDAVKILFFRVKKEAFVLSFQQVMFVLMTIYSCVLIPLYFMKKPQDLSKVSVGDAH